MAKAEKLGKKLLLPVDTTIAEDSLIQSTLKSKLRLLILTRFLLTWKDLTSEQRHKLFADAVKDAKTVVWNGPMGVFEKPNFAKGTDCSCKGSC